MSQNPVRSAATNRNSPERAGGPTGRARLLRWFLILFFIFAVLGIYACIAAQYRA